MHPAAVFVVLLCCLCGISARAEVLELRDSDFDDVTVDLETLLVKFYAPWYKDSPFLFISCFVWGVFRE